jgi:hypothetical protein
MLEEINRAAREAQQEEDAITAIRLKEQEGESGPLELPPMVPARSSGDTGTAPAPAPAPGPARAAPPSTPPPVTPPAGSPPPPTNQIP